MKISILPHNSIKTGYSILQKNALDAIWQSSTKTQHLTKLSALIKNANLGIFVISALKNGLESDRKIAETVHVLSSSMQSYYNRPKT
jgi:hypothetical protein